MLHDYSSFFGFSDPSADRCVLKDGRGVIKTRSLFLEAQPYKLREKYPPLYSLTEEEREGLPSAYQIYMHSTDEYDAAMKLVGSLRHWRKLLDSEWFMEGIEGTMFEGLNQWREDMMLRDASRSKKQLQAAAAQGDTASARKLLDTATPKQQKAPVGRPKEEKPPVDDGGRNGRLAALSAKHKGKAA